MNFLQLAQRLRLEAGLTGSGPASVENQSSDQDRRIVNWINQAYVEITAKHDDWKFMREDFAFDTAATDSGDYTAAQVVGAGNAVARYYQQTFRYYALSAGVAAEQPMQHWDFDDFRDVWRFGSNRTNRGVPQIFTETPAKGIWVAQIPNDVYRIVGQYQRAAREMTANTDVPALPEEFHMLLVYWAMVNYAGFEETSGIYAHANNMMGRLLPALERQERPDVSFGGPLA